MGRHARLALVVLLLLLLPHPAEAQQSAYREYIARWAPTAVREMNDHGIPASITLAQGLLESGAGKSRLAREANNHFGIKVGVGWTGPYIVMADDRPDDKFRVYKSAEESYADHSRFLTNGRRYAFLFRLSRTDYKGWARGLKQAGYATNPAYARSLIELIEKYHLDAYDHKTHLSRTEKAEQKLQSKAAGHEIRRCNGQFYVVAEAGDTYRSLARLMGKRERKLRRYNDVDKSATLHAGDIVYLGTKRKRADRKLGTKYHTLQAGESLYTVAQLYGVRLTSLCKMNPITADYHFKVGDRVRIR